MPFQQNAKLTLPMTSHFGLRTQILMTTWTGFLHINRKWELSQGHLFWDQKM